MWVTYYAEEITGNQLSVSADGPIAVAFHQTTAHTESGRVSGSGYYSGFTLAPSTTGGAAIPVDICQNGGTVNLVTEAGLPTGGTWSPALDSGTNIFDPSPGNDTAGIYTYTANDPCMTMTDVDVTIIAGGGGTAFHILKRLIALVIQILILLTIQELLVLPQVGYLLIQTLVELM